jgi:hypothetical protein
MLLCYSTLKFFWFDYFRTEEELTVGTRTINIIILKMYCISITRIVDNTGFLVFT